MRVENQTKTRVGEDSSLCPETSAENAVQEFYLSYGLSNFIDNPTYTEDSGII
jgi:hypothetical protein